MDVGRRGTRGVVGLTGMALAAVLSLVACSGDSTPAPDAPPVAKVAADPVDGAKDISPATPFKVTVAQGALTEVNLVDAEGKAVKGELAPDRLSWTSTGKLAFEKSYTWTGKATGTDNKPVEAKGGFTTLKPGKLIRATVNPTDNAVVGIAMPIKVEFDAKIKDKAAAEKALSVETTPKVEGAWAWLNDREVHYRPEKYWPANTKIKVRADLFAVPYGDGNFGRADVSTQFSIGRAQIVKAHTPSHKLVVQRDGQTVATYPASYGKDGNKDLNTPNGTYIVMQKNPVEKMDNPKYGYTNVMKKWAVRISNHGEFIHENNDNAANIGRANTSHGCANLLEADAKRFFDSALVGDPVEVTGSAGTIAPQYDVYDWQLTWNQWLSKSALR
ncbi:Lipoprotein-anchoring transpeptidase ErfK/SrfK [Allokutzneria albata]|uniref:Lipoprotein-anchoring transpeptidase ErfK/SrfK n=2 Tax=Allokutzneria albata TaxID=211114 RepID=A0A1G9Z8W4_ALLAB|nr:Lipoprotein-anchoring transpeptidase ErfK/SrfK [Allokutzneria albata]